MRKPTTVAALDKLGRARLPQSKDVRPHPRFLAWHREWHDLAA